MAAVLAQKSLRIKKLMFGIYKKHGFSLLELIVVLFLLGLVLTIAVPTIYKFFPKQEQRNFVQKFSSLVQLGIQEAVKTQQLHRMLLNVENKSITLEKAQPIQEKGIPSSFSKVDIPYIQTTISWPSSLVLKQCYIDSKDFLAQPGIKTEFIWFFLSPEGTSQAVILNWEVQNDNESDTNKEKMSLVLNPFTHTFKAYDSFQKTIIFTLMALAL